MHFVVYMSLLAVTFCTIIFLLVYKKAIVIIYLEWCQIVMAFINTYVANYIKDFKN